MRKDFRVPQTLKIDNGYRRYVCAPSLPTSVQYTDLLSRDSYMDPKFTYPVLHRPRPVPLVPQFVEFDKQCLTYNATFVETVAMYPEEMNRSRQVKILYFLEDDTIAVIEGRERVVRRGRHKKDSDSDYNWKDLNLGREIKLNGIRFQIVDCDQFTKNFMVSKGMRFEASDIEMQILSNTAPSSSSSSLSTMEGHKSGSAGKEHATKMDKLRRFLDFHGQVLSFDCEMENKDGLRKDRLTFKLYFFLEDSTISIKELKENQEGRHRFPLYLRRTRVPKAPEAVASFISAQDLRIGEIIDVYGTKFLLTDCDPFTRDYFGNTLREPQAAKLDTAPPPVERTKRQALPKYLGLGTPEDSLSSTFSLRPKTPTIGMPQNDEILRYTCRLEGSREDQGRRFILQFSVKHGTITITEIPVDNSGIMQGRFVTSQRVRNPDSDPDLPQFYGPADLMIDRIILVNCHRFRITGVDNCVNAFMAKYPEKFDQRQALG